MLFTLVTGWRISVVRFVIRRLSTNRRAAFAHRIRIRQKRHTWGERDRLSLICLIRDATLLLILATRYLPAPNNVSRQPARRDHTQIRPALPCRSASSHRAANMYGFPRHAITSCSFMYSILPAVTMPACRLTASPHHECRHLD